MKLASIQQVLDELWPVATAEAWDRPGLMLGSPEQEIRRVLFSVDVTAEVIDEAIERGCELVISHHPLFLRGVHELPEISAKGYLAARAIRANIAIISAHTNADFVLGGVTDSLARALSLTDVNPLDALSGHGLVGQVQRQSLLDFARLVARTLPATAGGVRVAGDSAALVSRVALVGGAGDSLLSKALESEADVFVTSDLRHHPVQDTLEAAHARGQAFAVIDVSHWAAESLWLDVAAQQVRKLLPDLSLMVSELRTDPWDFAVMQ